MTKKSIPLVLHALLLIGFLAQAQQSGEILMQKYAYIDAISIYERVAQKGHQTPELLRNLGDAYYFSGKMNQAQDWYAQLMEQEIDIPAEYYFRYAQTLKAAENYQLADQYLTRFKNSEPKDQRSLLFAESPNYLLEIQANSGRYALEIASVNSPFSDYGATVWKDQLLFSSARNQSTLVKRIHTWTGEPFTNIFHAAIQADGTLGKPKAFDRSLRSKFNEATPVFAPDGQTLYFTRNNFNRIKSNQDNPQNTLLKIYSASLINGKWGQVEELPFNSDSYSNAHPALTPDGKWMYFASDCIGSFGQSDLYKVEIYNDGTFGEPQNLGEQINTPGRESFPFISGDNELYFSSDGRPGLGGLDIYVTKIDQHGNFGPVLNIGAPANSATDDFAFYIDSQTHCGFLSSNRPANLPGDNIYAFVENTRLNLECTQNISGLVLDNKSQLPLENVELTLYDAQFNKIKSLHTNAKGSYLFLGLNCGTTYRMNAKKANFSTAEVTFTLSAQSGSTPLDFSLENSLIEIKKGDDLFKALKLKALSCASLHRSPELFSDLAQVVEVLKVHPKMKIELRVHTDSRGDAKQRSNQYAEATAKWIVAQGISLDRIRATGFGDGQLVNQCVKGLDCPEEKHQENCRVEFIVVDL